jgi:hypothetical protein
VEDTAAAKADTGQRTETQGVTVPHPEPLHLMVLKAVSHLFPEGGQRTARRNAWAAMSSNASHARDRREADLAIAAALGRTSRRVSAPTATRHISTV